MSEIQNNTYRLHVSDKNRIQSAVKETAAVKAKGVLLTLDASKTLGKIVGSQGLKENISQLQESIKNQKTELDKDYKKLLLAAKKELKGLQKETKVQQKRTKSLSKEARVLNKKVQGLAMQAHQQLGRAKKLEGKSLQPKRFKKFRGMKLKKLHRETEKRLSKGEHQVRALKHEARIIEQKEKKLEKVSAKINEIKIIGEKITNSANTQIAVLKDIKETELLLKEKIKNLDSEIKQLPSEVRGHFRKEYLSDLEKALTTLQMRKEDWMSNKKFNNLQNSKNLEVDKKIGLKETELTKKAINKVSEEAENMLSQVQRLSNRDKMGRAFRKIFIRNSFRDEVKENKLQVQAAKKNYDQAQVEKRQKAAKNKLKGMNLTLNLDKVHITDDKKMANKLDNILKEILYTEKTYQVNIEHTVSCLESLLNDDLVKTNKQMCKYLEERLTVLRKISNLSKNFVAAMSFIEDGSVDKEQKLKSMLQHFTTAQFQNYCRGLESWPELYKDDPTRNFKGAELELLSSKFKAQMETKLDDKTKTQELQAYLIMPIQRLPRIQMFLKEIILSTKKEDEEIKYQVDTISTFMSLQLDLLNAA